MLGYLNDADKTSEAIVEIDGLRWYKTGDKGHLDKDGFLTIVDRYSRFVKIGGEMVSLGAVEQAVNAALPDKDIEVCAAGVKDEKKGEKIVLLVEQDQDIDITRLRQLLIDAGTNAMLIPSDY